MSRGPVFVRVEIDGMEQRRQAEPLHLYNDAGQLVATALRPMTVPGEHLVERLGTYPKIIRETA
ncbi:hypothetical protein [Massilia sp. BKSP1R2A-1]|uniref:hypothetical protein n=1 Tax=Massilia sp. BKSP1R2A-1 TaxID=3422595 RepID=UPI003D346E3A